MDPSEWTEEEMNMFAIIFAAASAAMAAGEYCRNYLFRNPPRRADNERAWIINGIIRATDNDCISQLRMRKTTFFHLSSVLRDNNKLNDAKHVSMEEQLVMFLHTLGHNVRNRVIGHRFIRSGETVSRALFQSYKSQELAVRAWEAFHAKPQHPEMPNREFPPQTGDDDSAVIHQAMNSPEIEVNHISRHDTLYNGASTSNPPPLKAENRSNEVDGTALLFLLGVLIVIMAVHLISLNH